MAQWTKNKFSPISIKMLWDIDIGPIRQFPKSEKKNSTGKVLFGRFRAKKAVFAQFLPFFSPL
jgi:hypothetical protein